MRRKEFMIADKYGEDVEQFLLDMKYGILALNNSESYPIVKALNYVYFNGAIYFHGSKVGEKMNYLKEEKRATFSITQDYSVIPSYLEDPYFACPATTFFKSIVVKGKIHELYDEQEKHESLNAFMIKLQPEGQYSPIVYEDESYRKRVLSTAVMKLTIEELSHKFKFGQNWKEEKQDKVTTFLNERNEGRDEDSVYLMERYCPYHKNKSYVAHNKE